MEVRRRSFNLRRPVLNELSSRSSSDQSSNEFIFIEDDNFINNDRNIINNSNSSKRSIPEEEIIKTRGRKKTKFSPLIRDLSPNTLVTIKSPIKNAKNEDLLRFLRSPTPRKCKLKDDMPPVEVKKARKSLIIDLEVLNAKSSATSTPGAASTPANKKKQSSNKKTPNSGKKKNSLI